MFYILLFVLIFTLLLLFLFYIINFLLCNKNFYKNKVRAFECGFDSVGKIQNSFSIHFFIIILMFVIFDLEIVIFLGVLISDMRSFVSVLILFIFIIGGFYIE